MTIPENVPTKNLPTYIPIIFFHEDPVSFPWKIPMENIGGLSFTEVIAFNAAVSSCERRVQRYVGGP